MSPMSRWLCRPAPLGTALVGAVLMLLVGAPYARAQDARHLARFYYSHFMGGSVEKTPLDPGGLYSGEALDAGSKGELEVILWRRVGVGASRQTVAREFEDSAGQQLREEWVQYSANLTLYALRSRHYGFNLFAGGGTGTVERYRSSIARQPQAIASVSEGMALERFFAGIEYTFGRIGFRLETSRVEASKSAGGQSAELSGQTYQHFTVFIPFN